MKDCQSVPNVNTDSMTPRQKTTACANNDEDPPSNINSVRLMRPHSEWCNGGETDFLRHAISVATRATSSVSQAN